MVNYMLMITADLDNVMNLQPSGGCDDPNFSYYFKVKCGSCGEMSQKETCVSLNRTVPLPKRKGLTNLVQKVKCGSCGEMSQKETCVSLNRTVPLPKRKGLTNLVQKCKLCKREGTVTMVPGRGRPLTYETSQLRKYAPLMLFDIRGFEPQDFSFRDGWKVETLDGSVFSDVDLSDGEFAEYDEKGQCPVTVSNLRAIFNVVK